VGGGAGGGREVEPRARERCEGGLCGLAPYSMWRARGDGLAGDCGVAVDAAVVIVYEESVVPLAITASLSPRCHLPFP
jgi:hypothetical protein